MGNRAVIQFQFPAADHNTEDTTGLYVHWNGGIESIQAFLDAAKDYGVRSDDYGLARLAQIIGNYFGGTLSLGAGKMKFLDCNNWDNGTYVVKNWKIVERKFVPDYAPEEFDQKKYEGVLEGVREANDRFFLDKR